MELKDRQTAAVVVMEGILQRQGAVDMEPCREIMVKEDIRIQLLRRLGDTMLGRVRVMLRVRWEGRLVMRNDVCGLSVVIWSCFFVLLPLKLFVLVV